MESYTYGKSKSDAELVNIVKDSRKTRAKVHRFLMNFDKGIKEILKIENIYFKKRLLTMWKEERIRDLTILNIDDCTKTFMRTSIITRFRTSMREF